MNSQEIITRYAKIHTKEETLNHFMSGGAGSSEIEMGLAMFPRKIAEYWEEAQGSEEEEAAADEAQPTTESNITNLRMYADNGKAMWEYEGHAEDGSRVTCKGEIKSREFAINLARRTAERCNQHRSELRFDHGRNVEPSGYSTFAQISNDWGDLCLSQEALAAVETELRQARYNTEAGEYGQMFRNWNGDRCI